MKEIYFIRHGQTEYNRKKIIQGSGIDSVLDETGQDQARQFFNHYQHIEYDLVITSVLRRSQQTVKRFIDKGIRWEKTPLINEINWGIHEGKGGDPALIERYNALIAAWKAGNFDARVPEGESAAELRARCAAFVDSLITKEASKILVCTHGRTLRCLMTVIKDVPLPHMEMVKHANTGLYLVEWNDDAFAVKSENDTSHLDN